METGYAEPEDGAAVTKAQQKRFGVEIEGLESKELFISCYWSNHFGNHSLEGHCEADLGLHGEEVQRECKSEANNSLNYLQTV